MTRGGKSRKGRDGRDATEERKRKAAEEAQRRKEEAEAERLRIEDEERLAREAAEAEERRRLEEEAEIVRIAEKRTELRVSNMAATVERPALGKLKADIKKCSAFVKKLQKISSETKESLCKEFETLNLSRYVSEAVDNLCETKLKAGDVFSCVEVCSKFHQRYADFTPLLIPALLQLCAPPADRDQMAATVSRRRTLLRWLVEMIVCGIFTERMTALRLIADTIKADLEDPADLSAKEFTNLPIIVSFGKTSGYLFLPHADELRQGPPLGPTDVFDDKEKEILNKGFNRLFQSILTALQEVHKVLKRQEQANMKMLMGGGEMNVEALQAYTELRAAHDKLLDGTTSIALVLRKDIPAFEEEQEEELEPAEAEAAAPEDDNGDSEAVEIIWDDAEIRSFYVSLPELRALVPEVMFADSDTAAVTESAAECSEFDKLVAQLCQCRNKDSIDNWIVKFCRTNTKQQRARLVEILFDQTIKHKMQNISYLARGVAALTLKGLFTDIGAPLTALLQDEFTRLHKIPKKSQTDRRRLNVVMTFLGELVNFTVADPQTMFTVLRLCLDDFDRSVELACLALEICGHFLYRNSATRDMTTTLVETMFKMKNSRGNIDAQISTMVDNAYNMCRPPVLVSKEVVQKPPLHQYIERLLYSDIGNMAVDKIEKQLRKLPWDECEPFLIECFTNARKLKFNHISLVAQVAGKLSQQHESFGVCVADQVLEEVRYGMEINRWEHMQTRITTVKFLGELYVMRMVDSQAIFDTLSLLITLGYTSSRASQCAAPDPPEDFTRVRLVCTLLDAVGPYFTKGSSRKKLDVYLRYFMRYILSKPNPPVDVIFGVDDVFENLRPKMKRYETFEEACEEIEKLEAQEVKSAKIKGKFGEKAMRGTNAREVMAMETIEEDDGDDAAEECGGDEDAAEGDDVDSEKSDDDDEASDGAEAEEEVAHESESQANAVDLDDDRTFHRDVRAVREMEDDFDREFRQMMMESVNDRKAKGAATSFSDAGIPMSFERAKKSVRPMVDEEEDDEDEGEPTMQFQMLTRKGPKSVSARSLEVPLQCSFAAKTLAKEQAEMREREELTAKVLAYENHEAQLAHQEALAQARSSHRNGPTKGQRHKQQANSRQQQQQAAQQQTPTTPSFPYERR